MNNYWRMNRIGFVNFWLYDDQDYEFVDGKLLLRGQNGSGKSITTQSFIPFILDGDRTPSRLDPFGSSDRRMEYYFLGEEGKEDSTGYLYLEFRKPDTEEYRTIAIGQRARRGKPMDFWGFIILDNRRVGRDIRFYKQTGSVKIPFDRQEMRKALGEDAHFTDVPGEYKAMVNKYLFGFARPEQYEQFIKLLVKVRAPKLSKEFKPTKVYDILNESLPTLTDEELRPMVDAMEKMDAIQENLDQLRRSYGDVKVIRNEYTRYNQYMLAKKAEAYAKANGELRKLQQDHEEKDREVQNLTAEFSQKTQAVQECRRRLDLIGAELETLIDSDMEEAGFKLDRARKGKAEMEARGRQWGEKAEQIQEGLVQRDSRIRNLKGSAESCRRDIVSDRQRLQNAQSVLQWPGHDEAAGHLAQEQAAPLLGIQSLLKEYRNQIKVGRKAIDACDQAQKELDRSEESLEACRRRHAEKEIELSHFQDESAACIDRLIEHLYQMQKENQEWKLQDSTLKQAEACYRAYQKPSDAGRISRILADDYDQSRNRRNAQFSAAEQEVKEQIAVLSDFHKDLDRVKAQREIEPDRREEIQRSRQELEQAGIACVPFYRAVEFAPDLAEADRARLEAQLQMMGLLDALVIEKKDLNRIRSEFPKWADAVLYADCKGKDEFHDLILSEELSGPLREAAAQILSNIQVREQDGGTIYIGAQGEFRNGILIGHVNSTGEAAYVGALARKRKREQQLAEITRKIQEAEEIRDRRIQDKEHIALQLNQLQKEYEARPQVQALDLLLDQVRQAELEQQSIDSQMTSLQADQDRCVDQCTVMRQQVMHECRALPYGRTVQEYAEAEETLEDYQELWQHAVHTLEQLSSFLEDQQREEDQHISDENNLDDAKREQQNCMHSVQEHDLAIQKYEAYLQREDIREKAARRKQLKQEEDEQTSRQKELNERIVAVRTSIGYVKDADQKICEQLQTISDQEAVLQSFFDEELNLNLVIRQESRDLLQCAQEAIGRLEEKERSREPQDILGLLNKAVQQHSSNLIPYGTSLEECFDGEVKYGALRKRVLLISTWKGKKLNLEAFYETLKQAIEETELLIQQKDRELFEDILSQTIGQQLTERIADSRRWVKDMSELMKGMDTSMGLSFSLAWKPRSAEGENEIDTSALEQILSRDRALLKPEDIEKVAVHFRSRIKKEKMQLEEAGTVINYMDLVRNALDYRQWFEFQMFYRRTQEEKKPLTNAAFNRFSGGEKAMAMYVPLFAAVNAQYKKAMNQDHPRMIALDEAFAGVDDRNISSMFQLVSTLGFDYIMNSQSLWGCYETVKGLKIADLQRPANSQIVTVISYIWNGHERILDEG